MLTTPANLQEIQCIQANHPSLAGHFPGHPIVPGVVLLQRVERLITQHYPGFSVAAVNQAKFTASIQPQQKWLVDVGFKSKSPQIVTADFKIWLHPATPQQTLAATGQFRLVENALL
jgi:3-hydroxymyristoyl/3-hydroxydecanoyl-(acyl carrier protein) dehydratase